MPKDVRTRNWTFVIYPNEGNPPAPDNWRDILDNYHIPWCESPLHAADENADGSDKKQHIHILICFDGNKSFEQIKEITDSLNAPTPQKCANVRGLVRYFAHLDNPEKHQYSVSDIKGHGGFDVSDQFKLSATDRYQCIDEMMEWCTDNNIIEMEDLLLFARCYRRDDWFPLLCDNSAYIMTAFLKSRRHRIPAVRCDNNGEVI